VLLCPNLRPYPRWHLEMTCKHKWHLAVNWVLACPALPNPCLNGGLRTSASRRRCFRLDPKPKSIFPVARPTQTHRASAVASRYRDDCHPASQLPVPGVWDHSRMSSSSLEFCSRYQLLPRPWRRDSAGAITLPLLIARIL
jgi:hypothetical protein